jgi:hypothetical protein
MKDIIENVTDGEELQFIMNGVFAPVTILRRIFSGTSVLRAFEETIDRDAFVESVRNKKQQTDCMSCRR